MQDWFLDGSRREARAGARVIVWPEGSLLVFSDEEAAFLGRAARVASDEHVHLAMGMGTIHLGARLPFENKLVLIDPAGRVIVSYLKSHPVAGWEAGIMIRGDGRVPVVATGNGRVATAICFDADFPEGTSGRRRKARQMCSCCRSTIGKRSKSFISRCMLSERSRPAYRSCARPRRDCRAPSIRGVVCWA